MNNKFLALLILGLFAFTTSCESDEDTDLAEEIVGTYFMTSYETQLGASTPNSEDKVTITQTSDNIIQAEVDYAQTGAGTDINLNNMDVSEVGSTTSIQGEYDNADANGTVNGDDLQLTINYDDGNFAIINATK
ncbi:MAG: hypothetical protein AB8F74_02865 [Saprospiraceae bacterium]